MKFTVDLHIHSKYSRVTSKEKKQLNKEKYPLFDLCKKKNHKWQH